MSTVLKVLITLAVLLPVGGFVAGTLAANDTSGSPRETIVIRESAEDDAAPGTTSVTGAGVRPGERFVPEPTPDPTPPLVEDDDDDDDDDGPEPVVPQPVEVDDDDGDDDGDDDDDD